VRTGRAEKSEALAQLGQQVKAGVFGYPHPTLVAASKLAILSNANIKCGPAGEL
jgi:hypothetical protein